MPASKTAIDGCLQRTGRGKTASAMLYLVEELGDARLRCDQLLRYLDEATKLIEKSSHKDHLFEVAGHLIQSLPDTAFKLQKALQAVALATDRLDYEELKQELRPEKVEQLENVLKEVRIRPVHHRSENPMTPMKAAEKLRALAHLAREGESPFFELTSLVHALDPKRSANGLTPIADTLDKLASMVASDGQKISRGQLATLLSRIAMEAEFNTALRYASKPKLTQELLQLSSVEEVKQKFKEQNPNISDSELNEIAEQWKKNKDVVKDKTADSGMDTGPGTTINFENIRNLSIAALRASDGGRWRLSLLKLIEIVDEIGTILVQLGSMDTQKSEALKREIRQQMVSGRGPEPTLSLQAADAWKAERSAAGHSGDPHWITAKYPGKASDGTPFKKGDRVLYYPRSKTFMVGDKAEAAMRKFEGELADEAVYNYKEAAEEDEDKLSRFEEGKPADPTENMSPDDAAKWKDNTEEYGDKFKTALGPDAHLSRFEEGKPADPTENMSPEDAKRWKEEHAKNKDNFKSAGSVEDSLVRRIKKNENAIGLDDLSESLQGSDWKDAVYKVVAKLFQVEGKLSKQEAERKARDWVKPGMLDNIRDGLVKKASSYDYRPEVN